MKRLHVDVIPELKEENGVKIPISLVTLEDFRDLPSMSDCVDTDY